MYLMNKTFIYFIIILSSLSFISCKPENRIDISDGWQIKIGDSPAYRNISFDDTDWKTISLPAILTKERKRNVIWLRKTFFVPVDYRNRELAVQIGKVWDTEQTFINEIKIGSAGSEFPDFFSHWNYDRYYIIPDVNWILKSNPCFLKIT